MLQSAESQDSALGQCMLQPLPLPLLLPLARLPARRRRLLTALRQRPVSPAGTPLARRQLRGSTGDLRACQYEVTAGRDGLVTLLRNLVAGGKRISYTQGGSRWSGISSWTCPVANKVPTYADCSSFVSWVYWTAYGGQGGPDKLNGLNWKGGATGTMYNRGVQASPLSRHLALPVGRPKQHRCARCAPAARRLSPPAGCRRPVANRRATALCTCGTQVSKATVNSRGVKQPASYSNAQPGDLVFYGPGTHSHVAIYIGNGQVTAHAPACHSGWPALPAGGGRRACCQRSCLPAELPLLPVPQVANFGSTGPVKILSINFHSQMVEQIRSFIGPDASQF